MHFIRRLCIAHNFYNQSFLSKRNELKYTNTTVNTQLENRPNDKSLTVRKDIEYIIIIKSAVCCKQTKTINELNII